jgi:hypothetical protein
VTNDAIKLSSVETWNAGELSFGASAPSDYDMPQRKSDMHKFIVLVTVIFTLAFCKGIYAQESMEKGSFTHEFKGNTHFFYETLATDSSGRISGHKRQFSILLSQSSEKSRDLKKDLKKVWQTEVKKLCGGWFMGNARLMLSSATQATPVKSAKVLGISGDFKCLRGR